MKDLLSNIYVKVSRPKDDAGLVTAEINETIESPLDSQTLFDITIEPSRLIVVIRGVGGHVIGAMRIEGEVAVAMREQIEKRFADRMLGNVQAMLRGVKESGPIVGGHDLGEFQIGAYRGQTAKWWAKLLSRVLRWQVHHSNFIERQLPTLGDRHDGVPFDGEEISYLLDAAEGRLP